MFNSQNLSQDLPASVAQSAKPVRKTKVFSDLLTYPELQAFNLKLARLDYITAIRQMLTAEIEQLDGNWLQMLTA